MRALTRTHLPLVSLLVVLFGFLILRAQEPYRWSDWSFADAQDMLALEHWKHEGFSNLHFLWVPQGYSNVAKLLDEPEVNHLAHGTDKRSTGLALNKRIYTHYPSGYALPYGVLKVLGVDSKTGHQYFALALSLVSLCFLYSFLCFQFSRGASAGIVALYTLSYPFLGYCDSLNTMPYDDLARFAFIYFWHRARAHQNRVFFTAALGTYFLSAMTSIDSILFIAVWALVSDALFYKQFCLRDLGLLALAPLSAITVQFTQNAAYLGPEDAFLDWYNTFFQHSAQSNAAWLWKLGSRLKAALTLFSRTTGSSLVFIGVLGLGIAACLRLNRERQLWVKLLLTFLLASSALVLVLPHKTNLMVYQVRVYGFFAALLLAAFLATLSGTWRELLSKNIPRAFTVAFLGVVTVLYAAQMYVGLPAALDYPARPHLNPQLIAYLEKVKGTVPGDRVIFQLRDALPVQDPYWEFPTAHPLAEHHLGGLLLWSPDEDRLAKDLSFFWARKESVFTPIVITKQAETARVSGFFAQKGISLHAITDDKLGLTTLVLVPASIPETLAAL